MVNTLHSASPLQYLEKYCNCKEIAPAQPTTKPPLALATLKSNKRKASYRPIENDKSPGRNPIPPSTTAVAARRPPPPGDKRLAS
ncbi:hypothetical protein GWI33_005880 [Rhynchophorus ferrugineus]|uniref:Uncharacterized protein n=1 Tax=Rhynchophorus ferrugineus TaxID=354439 RepID=A0A834IFP9_RHYFE|nr:hypothetical protein GWI33_005880 [Rhynchophorus ferrugineus]